MEQIAFVVARINNRVFKKYEPRRFFLMNTVNLISAYVQSKRVALAQEICRKKKIYLDTKYWALLRDVRLKRSRCKSTSELLSRIEELVKAGKAICPLNADVFFEVFKQNDRHTLQASVELMDDLSCGICLLPLTERIPAEVFHFMEANRKGTDKVFRLDELMWTKAAYIIGFVTPSFSEMSDQDSLRIQKEFADDLWTIRLKDMLRTMSVDKAASKRFAFPDISSELNEGKMSSLDEHKSFKSLFLCEVQGMLDVHKPEFASLMRYLYERDTGKALTQVEAANDDSGQLIANLIYHAFRLNKVERDALPSIRIGAALHSALRWDRNRNYKSNDLFDFRHAEAALSYCDYFFTEKSLCHLVQNRNMKLSETFECQVHHRAEDALTSLSSIQ